MKKKKKVIHVESFELWCPEPYPNRWGIWRTNKFGGGISYRYLGTNLLEHEAGILYLYLGNFELFVVKTEKDW